MTRLPKDNPAEAARILRELAATTGTPGTESFLIDLAEEYEALAARPDATTAANSDASPKSGKPKSE